MATGALDQAYKKHLCESLLALPEIFLVFAYGRYGRSPNRKKGS